MNLGEIEVDDLGNILTQGTCNDLVNMSMRNRLPPLTPDQFRQKLKTEKTFTNGNLDFERVAKLYATFFDVVSTSVTELLFNAVGWSAHDLRDLANALKEFKKLEALYLNDNNFGDEAAQFLAGLLKTNNTIRRLEIANNSIGDNGAVALAHALKANSTIATFLLGSGNIGDEGAVALADALKANETITVLGLANHSIGDDGVVSLAGALEENTTLLRLQLWGNSFGDKGADAIQKANQVEDRISS